MWFKKKKETKKNDSLIDQYKKDLGEIEHLESQYDDYILSSLEIDFDKFKSNLDQKWPSFGSERDEFWNFSDSDIERSLILVKANNSNSSGRDYLKLSVQYEFDSKNLTFKVTSLSLSIKYETQFTASVRLEPYNFGDIIYKYYICVLAKKTRLERDKAKLKFQKMTDIIGTAVKRDALIDKILDNDEQR